MIGTSASPRELPGLSKGQLLAAARDGRLDRAAMAALQTWAAGPLERTSDDAELLLAYAQAAWIADQRTPSATRSRDAARRLTDLLPNLRDGYRLLGLAHLTRGEPQSAFTAFTAARAAIGDQSLDNFRALAENLMRGARTATFVLDGVTYRLPLTCHNAAAIEAGAFHSVGLLTEIDDLRALAAAARDRPVSRLAEIGVLIGNHTAFFLNAFRLDHLVLVDADAANLPFISDTVTFNTPAGRTPVVETISAFVGRGGPAVPFAGGRVAHRRLDEVVTGPIDLIKIDVDGAEAELLQHGGAPLERDRPIVMIETAAHSDAAVQSWFAARAFGPPQMFDHGGYRNLIYTPGRAAT